MLAASDREISPGEKKHKRPFQEFIAAQLKQIGLIYSFQARPIANGGLYEVLVRIHPKASEVNLKDVGFGVSQILPVVVQSFYAPPHSTILLEQPEIHLHPSAQANLADVFLTALRARENGENRDVQFIIESHSEHFLRRVQTLIAEEKLHPDEVALYFCSPERDGLSIEEVQVDDLGNIRNWPENFFGDQMGEIVRKQQAQIERRMKGEANDGEKREKTETCRSC